MKRAGLLVLLAAALVVGCSLAGAKPAAPVAPVTPPVAGGSAAPGGATVPAANAAPVAAPLPEMPAPRAPQLVLEPAQVQQGEMAVLRLDAPVTGDVTVRVEGLSEQPKVYRLAGCPIAFVGFPADARVGTYPVTVTWPEGKQEAAFEVVWKKFTEDRLTVSQDLQDTYYDPRQDAEWAHMFDLRSQSSPRPLWKGPFRAPLNGALTISTYFGEIRYVNGTETNRHSGMDFAAAEGTPVLAPAPGRVTMTEKMIVTGNTLIIDHGLNLYTTYYHLSAFSVKPGDWVEPGQEIGKVGSTGFSTGPHLHWTATIGNTPVNPMPLTQASPLGIADSRITQD